MADAAHAQAHGGDDGEAAAAAAQCPEQVVVVRGVDPPQRAVGGDDVQAAHAVERQPHGAPGQPDAAAQHEPTEPHRRARAGGDGHAVGGKRGVDVAEPGAGSDRRDPVGVERHVAQPAQIDDDGVAAGRVAVVAVAARAGHERHAEPVRPGHRGAHVGEVADLHDRRWADAVVAAVEHDPGGVVARVPARHDPPAHGGPQRAQLRLGQPGGLGLAPEQRGGGEALEEAAAAEHWGIILRLRLGRTPCAAASVIAWATAASWLWATAPPRGSSTSIPTGASAAGRTGWPIASPSSSRASSTPTSRCGASARSRCARTSSSRRSRCARTWRACWPA